jgi:ceramide glucosyltransferase
LLHTAALFFFYFFATIAILLGLMSLRGGVRFARYLRSELAKSYPEFTPFASVFVPCRGLDDGLKENIHAIIAQDYPEFEIVFVSDRADDSAFAVAEEVRNEFKRSQAPSIRFVIAGPAIDSGQKVHNLRAAVAQCDARAEVFAFVDTDARPQPCWLRELVAPLKDEAIGATTGYRWFVPSASFASHLRSVWNASIASALGAREDKNFCWGGSTAIRREAFDRIKVSAAWRGTVSDDFAMTRALRKASLPIKFVPQCLTPSFDDCVFRKLFEFTTRQLKITRAYASHLWKAVLIGNALFGLAFFGGIVLVVARAVLGLSFLAPSVTLSIIFLLGALKSFMRLRAVSLVIKNPRTHSYGTTLAHLILWPLASLLFLYNALAAAVSRRITWRGITYKLKSPRETVIIRRDGA